MLDYYVKNFYVGLCLEMYTWYTVCSLSCKGLNHSGETCLSDDAPCHVVLFTSYQKR